MQATLLGISQCLCTEFLKNSGCGSDLGGTLRSQIPVFSQSLQGHLGGPSPLVAGGWALRGAASRPLPTVPAVPCQQLWLLFDSGNTVPPPPRPHPGGISLGDMGGQEHQVARPHCTSNPKLYPHPSPQALAPFPSHEHEWGSGQHNGPNTPLPAGAPVPQTLNDALTLRTCPCLRAFALAFPP